MKLSPPERGLFVILSLGPKSFRRVTVIPIGRPAFEQILFL
jgi:hypothetical protein